MQSSLSNQASTLLRFSPDVVKITGDVYGDEAPQALAALTEPVRKYFVRCNTHKISPEELRHNLLLRGIKATQHPVVREALGLPVEGPFNVPSFQRNVVVDKRTAEAVLQGANVYAPGIQQCESLAVNDEVSVRSEFGELLASGRALMSASDILTFRKGLAILVHRRRFKSTQIREQPEFHAGLLYPQSLAAMVTTKVLDPQPEDTIVDLNCAPGGKLSHMSQLMQNSGRIYGFDRNSEKIAQTRRILSQLGCTNVILSVHDSRYIHEDLPRLQADKVLVDPPCSALGLKPKLYDFSDAKRIENLAAYQKQFVLAASKIVKPGGIIVYSVCTFTTQECEGMVEEVAHEFGLRVVQQEPIVGSSFGLPEFTVGRLCQRFQPHKDEIGYFIAKFQR